MFIYIIVKLMKIKKIYIKNKKKLKSRKPNYIPFLLFRVGSFAVYIGDHLRSHLGIMCGLIWGSFSTWGHLPSGIICGRGSFAFSFGDHFRSGDHLWSGMFWALYRTHSFLFGWDHLQSTFRIIRKPSGSRRATFTTKSKTTRYRHINVQSKIWPRTQYWWRTIYIQAEKH